MAPSNGEPYTFMSADEAERMSKVCYPDHQSIVTIEPTTPAAATNEERMIQVNPERLAYARKSAGLSTKQIDAAVSSKAHEGKVSGGVKLPRRKCMPVSSLESATPMIDCYEWQVNAMRDVLGVRDGWLSISDPMPSMESQRVRDMLGK